MARNVEIRLLRGTRANIPTLGIGELYLATDETQLYVGTTFGNKLVIGQNVLAITTGKNGNITVPLRKTGDPGPTVPQTVAQFTSIIINGITYWIPLMR